MIEEKKIIDQIGEKLSLANNILIISHRRPDADTIGANLSLRRALIRMGKNVISACHDEISFENYFLPDVYTYVQDIGDLGDYDLIIAVDCGDSKITNYHTVYPDIFSGKYPVINIDHHVSNDNFGDINLVCTHRASTTEIMFTVFRQLDMKIDKDMATLLLAGLYFDTGSFKHDNTTVHVLEVAAELSSLGANAGFIAKNMFRMLPIPVMRVWGKVLTRTRMNDKKIVSSFITTEEMKEIDGVTEDIKGADLISYLNSVPDAKFTMLLSEKKGLVKGSFRTSRDDIDVAVLAKKLFKGGGHKKAAGFAVEGKINNSGQRVIVSEE